MKLKHIKSWSLLFCFHFVTLGRRLKITYKYVALFTFFIDFIITRIRNYRPGVGRVEETKLRTNFKCHF